MATKRLTALMAILMIIALAPLNGVHAAEVTGTLSNDPAKTKVNNQAAALAAPQNLHATAQAPPGNVTSGNANSKPLAWDIPLIVKAALISFLILEVIILLAIKPAKKPGNPPAA